MDDATGYRYVQVTATAEIREDVTANLSLFRAIREKHGRAIPPDEELAAALIAEDRILLVFTPSAPAADWTAVGLG